MSVSNVLVSGDLVIRWSSLWAGTLLRDFPQLKSDRQMLKIWKAYVKAFGMKEVEEITSRALTSRADTAPLSLPMVKDWAKAQHKALRAAKFPFTLNLVQEAWASALGASGWKGVPGQIQVLNDARAQHRNRWGAIKGRAPVNKEDFILVDQKTLAWVDSVVWKPKLGRWFVTWDTFDMEGNLLPHDEARVEEGPFTEIERVAEPQFPLDPANGPLHQRLTYLAPRNDLEGRRLDLTMSAIDWALSIVEEMFEFTGGDASALADMAVTATLDTLGDEHDDEDSFDHEALEKAIQTEFDALEAEQDEDRDDEVHEEDDEEE